MAHSTGQVARSHANAPFSTSQGPHFFNNGLIQPPSTHLQMSSNKDFETTKDIAAHEFSPPDILLPLSRTTPNSQQRNTTTQNFPVSELQWDLETSRRNYFSTVLCSNPDNSTRSTATATVSMPLLSNALQPIDITDFNLHAKSLDIVPSDLEDLVNLLTSPETTDSAMEFPNSLLAFDMFDSFDSPLDDVPFNDFLYAPVIGDAGDDVIFSLASLFPELMHALAGPSHSSKPPAHETNTSPAAENDYDDVLTRPSQTYNSSPSFSENMFQGSQAPFERPTTAPENDDFSENQTRTSQDPGHPLGSALFANAQDFAINNSNFVDVGGVEDSTVNVIGRQYQEIYHNNIVQNAQSTNPWALVAAASLGMQLQSFLQPAKHSVNHRSNNTHSDSSTVRVDNSASHILSTWALVMMGMRHKLPAHICSELGSRSTSKGKPVNEDSGNTQVGSEGSGSKSLDKAGVEGAIAIDLASVDDEYSMLD